MIKYGSMRTPPLRGNKTKKMTVSLLENMNLKRLTKSIHERKQIGCYPVTKYSLHLELAVTIKFIEKKMEV